MFSKFIVLSFLCFPMAMASYERADRSFGQGNLSLGGYRKTILHLVNDGYYFSTVPWMKDYIVRTDRPLDNELEEALDKMLYHTGVKPFESLPVSVLERSRSGNIRYILAKRLFKKKKYREALMELQGIQAEHPAYPYVTHLLATINSHVKDFDKAQVYFRECIRTSEKLIGKDISVVQKNQLSMNRDYCIAGIGRVQFAQDNFKKAELSYLDIPKDSFVWPEILFEEAWTSYYMKNYNRTLGKLVSYKAPVFDFIFNPEVEVLRALTYLKMCLYEDARKTADGFYQDLLEPARDLRKFILRHKKDYRYYYGLMADHEDKKPSPLPIVTNVLKSVQKDAAYIEMKSALSSAIAEYNELRKKGDGTMNKNLVRNVKTLVDEYRTTLGAYVRSGLVSKYAQLYSAFQDMSYIKLEVLAQKKERLYESDVADDGKRGDVKYIERNDKQYFWTFNGEFWADELGDYVFALRSEC